jgi:hypothetical protein
LNTDPSKSATYVAAAAAHAFGIMSPAGAFSTAGLVKADNSPPTTVAVRIASTVTVTVLASRAL